MSEKPITIAKLDTLASFVVNPPTKSRIEVFFAACKILLMFAYVFTRKKLMDLEAEEFTRKKQEHQIKRDTETLNDLKGDSLDGA